MMPVKNVRGIKKGTGSSDQVFYHYCGLDSLFGMITSKSLWLTSLESTNDKKELKFGQETFNKALQGLIDDENYKDIRKELMKILNAPKDLTYKRYRPNFKYYGMSFISNKDSLTHWERYGNDGYGVCLGINFGMIDKLFEDYGIPKMCSSWIYSNQIIYEEEKQIDHLQKSVLNEINGFYYQLRNKENTQSINITDIPHICNSIYYNTLAQSKPIFKDHGFSDEKEIRLVFEEGQAEEQAKYYSSIASEVEYTDSFLKISKHLNQIIDELDLYKSNKQHGIIGDTIRSYYAMNLSKIWSDKLITEVIIGPRCFQNRKELKSFLKANGLNRTNVNISDIPIR